MPTIEFKSKTTGQMLLVAARLVAEVRAMTPTYTLLHLIHGQVLVVCDAETDVRAKLGSYAPA
jgi:hypothetical protein